MKKLFTRMPIILFAILLLVSCQKASEDDGQLSYLFKSINFSASLSATAASSGQIVAPLSNGSITWTSGTMNVQKIEFNAKKDQVAFGVEAKDLFNIDILSSGIIAGTVTLPAGTYGDIGLKVNLVQSSANAPLVLKGTYTEISGTQIPVEVQFNETYLLQLHPAQIIIKGDKYNATIILELNNLVKNIAASDFGQTTRTNGKILVTSTINAALYAKLGANLLNSVGVQITHQ